jgi:ABC-type uncharacterized transport system substrate-binding protein
VTHAIVTTMLRYAIGAAGVLLCLCVQANTLGIVTSGQGAAYDEFVETVRSELKSVPGLKIQLIGPSAEGSAARLPDDTFMVLTMGVLATRTTIAAQADSRWPILSVMVPRTSFEAFNPVPRNARRISAIYIDQPPQRQLELIRIVLPTARKIAVVVGPANQRDLDAIRPLATAKGLTLVTENAARDTELYPALQSILRSSDVLLALPDPYVINVSTAQNLLLTALRFRVPVIGYSAAYVRAGALAAAYSTPRHIGLEAAQLARQVLRGSAMPAPRHPRNFSVAINRALADSLGLDLPEEAAVQQRLQSLESSE